jgi:signal recognition particle subunit SEC65
MSRLSIDNPSINEIMEALKELKYRDKIAINTLGSLA